MVVYTNNKKIKMKEDVFMIKGIDVSNWQGNIDFSKVKNAGYEIAYIKATEGEHTLDKNFNTNYANAKASGINIGFYHFLHGNESGKTQAEWMYSNIKDKEFQCKIAIDVEVTDGANADTLSQIVCDFAETIKSLTGKEVVLYTYTSFLGANLNSSIDKYPLWIAEYGVSQPRISRNYVGWQYADNGQVDGCPNGNTDLDYFTEEIYTTSSKENVKVTAQLQTQPTNSSYHVGEEVTVVGNTYSTGQAIPSWVKEGSYPIIQVDSGKVLLGNGLDSWVNNDGVSPVSVKAFQVGENVKVVGSTYATGQAIPSWVQGQVYPIIQVDSGKVLLGGGLMSWLPNDGVVSTSVSSFQVGQNVRIIANNYSTGQAIPAWVKQNTYPITQVGQGKCLLGNGLDSWVDDNGLVLA